MINKIFHFLSDVLSVLAGIVLLIVEQIKKGITVLISHPKETKTFLFFSGLLYFPVFLFLAFISVDVIASLTGARLTGVGHLLVFGIALAISGAFCLLNLRDRFLYKKRCYSSLSEWWHEGRYSAARRKAMYPPIKQKMLRTAVTGICIGKIGFGLLKRYVCIDLYDKHIANHIVIIGNSSAGKSSGPILTSLIANFQNCDENTPPPLTFLVVDPKPELCRKSSMCGKWTRILNPMAERGTSYGWDLYYDITKESPLDKITDRIRGIVNVIVQDGNEKNAFFQDSARNLLAGCLIYEFVAHGNNFIKSMRNILSADLDSYVKTVKSDQKCPKNSLMLLSEFGNEKDQSNATADIKKSLKQQTDVFTRSDTEWFLDTDVNQLMCSPECLDESISMFLSIKRADLYTFGVLFRLIISQCSEHLSRREDDNLNDKPVVILIDEFTNLGGTVPNFAENLGFIRSKKVTYVTIFQQYSQLEQLYGEKQARTILNMGHQLILSCEDTQLGKIFSDKAGEFTETKTSYKQTGGLFTYTSGEGTISQTKEKRIRVMDDLTSLVPRKESIAFINGNEYYRFDKCRYYMESTLLKRSEECERFHSQYAEADTTDDFVA